MASDIISLRWGSRLYKTKGQQIRFADVHVGDERSLTYLRQLEILTSCFTLTFRAEKATWHYITLNGCILGFEGQSTAHFAVG